MLHSHRQRHMYYSSAHEEFRYGKLCVECTYRICLAEAIGAGDGTVAPTRGEIAQEVNNVKFRRQGFRMEAFHAAVRAVDERRKTDRANDIFHHNCADTRRRRRAREIGALLGEHLIRCCERRHLYLGRV